MGLYLQPQSKSKLSTRKESKQTFVSFKEKEWNESDNASDNKATMVLAFDPNNDLKVRDTKQGPQIVDPERNNSLQDRHSSAKSEHIEDLL